MTPWRFPIMKRDGFKCTSCGTTGDLVVHHDKERFAAIQKGIIGGRDVRAMTFEEQGEVARLVLQYHLDEGVSGITLCWSCHDLVHEIDPDTD